MCLLVKPGSIKVEDKDIITYKIVDLYYGETEKWRGHYYPHKSFDFDIVINEGGTPESEMHLTYNKENLAVGRGFLFSTKNKTILKKLEENSKSYKNVKAVVCKCIIPKGTKYYKLKGDYASEQLMVCKPKLGKEK